MNKEQLYAAQTAMIEWLSDPHELGKKPFKIECAGEFDFNEMHYYIFKFKASLKSLFYYLHSMLIHLVETGL